MAEYATIARPYAQAVFELARNSAGFPRWSETLGFLAAVAQDPQVATLLDSPRLTGKQLAELFLGICGEHIDESGANLVRLLAENRRLVVLPEIAQAYEAFRHDAEGVIYGELISAYPASEQQQQQIAAALKARLGRQVELKCTIDASLVGGAIVRAGDLVIDGSILGKLTRLANALGR